MGVRFRGQRSERSLKVVGNCLCRELSVNHPSAAALALGGALDVGVETWLLPLPGYSAGIRATSLACNLNQQFCISQEQLEQIRQLRAVPEPEQLQERKNNER